MNKDDVKKLAGLARMEISDDELEKTASEIDSVLNYIDQIKTATSNGKAQNIESSNVRNVFREDKINNDNLKNKENEKKKLVSASPDHDEDFIRVKKIL